MILWNITAKAISTVDEKYHYGAGKFWKEIILAFVTTLVLGVGLFLLDFGTDISFSVDMYNMSKRNFSEEISECRGRVLKMNERYFEMDCFQLDNTTENFRCLNYLGELQQEAKRCFERKQHFQNPQQFQFGYMRNNLKLFYFLSSIIGTFSLRS